MAANTHNKTLHPMPPDAHQHRTQDAAKKRKQPTGQQTAEKNKHSSPRKTKNNLRKRLALSCTAGRGLDDDGKPPSAATEPLAGGIITTPTQTRNLLPPASTTAPAEQRTTSINIRETPTIKPVPCPGTSCGKANHSKLERGIPTNTTTTSKCDKSQGQTPCHNHMAAQE